MSPRWLFPLLALAFVGAAVLRFIRLRRLDPAARTWALLSAIFGAVAAWMTFVH
jgi:uncharacterized membrane protein HdeD (DUF308 family)